MSKETYAVLVADDSSDDRLLLKAALRKTPRLKLAGEASDGLETLAYLKGDDNFGDREKFPLPDLLLLDLKMPLLDGFEVLEWLRTQFTGELTVVVLTGSMLPQDIKRALDLGADLFQVKPRTNHEREAMVIALEKYLTNSGAPIKRPIPLARLRPAHQAGAGIY